MQGLVVGQILQVSPYLSISVFDCVAATFFGDSSMLESHVFSVACAQGMKRCSCARQRSAEPRILDCLL